MDTVGSYECYCKTGQDYDPTKLECKGQGDTQQKERLHVFVCGHISVFKSSGFKMSEDFSFALTHTYKYTYSHLKLSADNLLSNQTPCLNIALPAAA